MLSLPGWRMEIYSRSLQLLLFVLLPAFMTTAQVANGADNIPDLCSVCACAQSDKQGVDYPGHVTCNVMAIVPDDLAIMALQNQSLKSLSLVCMQKYSQSFITSSTLGSLVFLESLSVENCNLASGLSSESFEDLSNLSSLSFNNSVLPQIADNDFSGASYLSSLALNALSLTYCDLSRIPSLAPSQWNSLTQLNVSNNNLKTLDFFDMLDPDLKDKGSSAGNSVNILTDPFIQRGSENSRTFNSSDKNSEDVFHTNLKVLDLSNNPLTSLPSDIVAASSKLETLLLRGVALRDFNLPETSSLLELVYLDAKESQLVSFEFARLDKSVNLQEMHLQGSGVSVNFPDMSSLSRLTALTLVRFGINSSIWDQLRCPFLDALDLTENNITSVDTKSLKSLRILRLGQNDISELAPSTYHPSTLPFPPSNTTLSLQHSSLSSPTTTSLPALDSFIADLPELQLVNLSSNHLTTLPLSAFSGSQNLLIVDLSRNQLSTVQSGTFKSISRLVYLDLSHNNVSSLGYSLFADTPEMARLYLQHNSLGYLPKLNSMTQLQWLNISHNQLLSIEPRHLSGLSNLTILHADHNQLLQLSSGLLSATPSLLEAYFNHNKIKFVSDLGYNANLLTLRLDSNQIPDFSSGSPFHGLERLQYLFLGNNHLISIENKPFPRSLQILFLGQNYFEYLRQDVFTDLPNLKYVSLAGNQNLFTLPPTTLNVFTLNQPKPVFDLEQNMWFCDCSMAYLKHIYETGGKHTLYQYAYPQLVGLETTVCLTYKEDKAEWRQFTEVPYWDFACPFDNSVCEGDCNCCDKSRTINSSINLDCPCQLSCPLECACYIAGASIDKTYLPIHCDARNLSSMPDNIPIRATTLFLNGNNITSLYAGDLAHLSMLEVLYLNTTGLGTIEDATFQNCTSLVSLYLDHNSLTIISSHTFAGIYYLEILQLHDNLLHEIAPDAFSDLISLKELTLHNNRLVKLSAPFERLSLRLTLMTLSGNPWTCDCADVLAVKNVLHVNAKVIDDQDQVCCSEVSRTSVLITQPQGPASGQQSPFNSSSSSSWSITEESNNRSAACHPIMELDLVYICSDDSTNSTDNNGGSKNKVYRDELPQAVIFLIILTVVLCVAASFSVLAIFRRRELQALTLAKLGVRVFDKKVQNIDKTEAGSKAFDAFISYSSKDDEFVVGTLIPALEDASKGYRVCIHYRDFPVGHAIGDSICRAIESSSRTILLLTPNFLTSDWCRFEFQSAHHHILTEGSHRLIIIIKGDVTEEMLDPDLQLHLKTRPYLKFEDALFWEKLFFSLPDIRERRATEKQRTAEESEEDQKIQVLKNMNVLVGGSLRAA